MSNSVVALVVECLEGVASGAMDASKALARIQPHESALIGKSLLVKAWQLIQHYGDDEDLHAKDAGYRESQVEAMRKLAGRLRDEGV